MSCTRKFYFVDDDADDRFLVCAALAEIATEISIVEAVDGLHFMELVEHEDSQSVAVVLLDMNMPRMNGLETLQIIKSNPILSNVPIVMFSTAHDKSLARQAYQLGVRSFYTKRDSFDGFIELAKIIVSVYL